MTKQVIVMRKDLGMRKGKMIAQGAHASLGVILDMMDIEPINHVSYRQSLEIFNGTPLDDWINGTFTKICLAVNSEEELLEIFTKAKEAKLPSVLITDSGKTEFNGVQTNTCLAIGPAKSEEIDLITGDLSLL